MPASRAVSFLYLIPVAAYLIAWVWIGEVPTLLSVVGGCVTLAGVLIVNTLGRRGWTRRTPPGSSTSPSSTRSVRISPWP